MCRIAFDEENLILQYNDLENQASQSNFWDNPNQAKLVMTNFEEVKDQLSNLKKWKVCLSDSIALIDLYSKDSDEELLAEGFKNLKELSDDLDRWELERLLSGPYDKNDAILTINAGAGGTDAQDWAEMLMRMYKRWSEEKNMRISVNEISEGEEAGIKSVTLEIEGRYAYGYLQNEKGTHRLVRISPFNANDKRQTSFAGVEVMPRLDEEVNIDIPDKDIFISKSVLNVKYTIIPIPQLI